MTIQTCYATVKYLTCFLQVKSSIQQINSLLEVFVNKWNLYIINRPSNFLMSLWEK